MKTATKKKSTKPAATPAPETIKLPEGPPPVFRDIETIPLDRIRVDKDHESERLLDDTQIQELARSLATNGLLQPIGVVVEPDGDYRVVYGRRRVAAARLNGWEHIDAALFPADMTEEEILEARDVENLQRLNLNPAEEAIAIVRLVESYERQLLEQDPDCKRFTLKSTDGSEDLSTEGAKALRAAAVAKAAERLAKPPQWIRDRLFIARLDDRARELVLSGDLPLAHAREIAKVADPTIRSELAKRAAVNPKTNLPMSLADLQTEVRQNLLSLAQVPWKLDVTFAGKPACVECPHNSANLPGLFDHHSEYSRDRAAARSRHTGTKGAEPAAGVCTLPSCFAEKNAAANAKLRSARDKAVRAIQETKPAKGASKPAPTPTFVAQFTPDFVKPATVATMAKERLTSKPAKKSGRMKVERRQEVPYDQRPEYLANNLLWEHRREWRKKYEPLISEALNAKPGRWALLQLIRCTKAVEATEAWQEAKSRKAASLPLVDRLLKLLDDPNWEAVLAVQKECGTKFGVIDDHSDLKSGLAEKIAKSLGIECVPLLTEADALAKVKADLAAKKEKSAKKAAKKSAKKAAKKKTGKSAAQVEKDLDDEDRGDHDFDDDFQDE